MGGQSVNMQCYSTTLAADMLAQIACSIHHCQTTCTQESWSVGRSLILLLRLPSRPYSSQFSGHRQLSTTTSVSLASHWSHVTDISGYPSYRLKAWKREMSPLTLSCEARLTLPLPYLDHTRSIIITRICAAEMAVRYAALCACRKVHT